MDMERLIEDLRELKPFVLEAQERLLEQLDRFLEGKEGDERILASKGWIISLGQMARVGFEAIGLTMTVSLKEDRPPVDSLPRMPPMHGMN